MAAVNTGYLIQPTLKRVVNGGPHDGEALDVNNNLCSQSGLPQHKESNPTNSSTYKVYNTTSCPLP